MFIIQAFQNLGVNFSTFQLRINIVLTKYFLSKYHYVHHIRSIINVQIHIDCYARRRNVHFSERSAFLDLNEI